MLRSKTVSRTEPTTEPVTAVEVRGQLLFNSKEFDTDLALLAEEARRDCEEVRLGRVALITQTCVDKFAEFAAEMELGWAPASSITTVQYVDIDGDTQTASDSLYELGTVNGRNVCRLKYGQNWPSIRDQADAVTITYVAGYGTAASDVPPAIRRWVRMRAAWLWQHRDGDAAAWPPHVDEMLAPFATCEVIA